MSAITDKIRKSIGESKTETALNQFAELARGSADTQTEILTLMARYREARKRENLGLMDSEKAQLVYAQVNYTLLGLIRDYEMSMPNPEETRVAGNSRKVFISYNHSDRQAADELTEKLRAAEVEVVIDHDLMQAGEDIQQFIENCIKDTGTTIAVVSKRSLLSAWVAMESINTFYAEKAGMGKKFIACYLENDFFNLSFTDEALNVTGQRLKEIEVLKSDRIVKGRDTRDLNNEYSRLKDLYNNMDKIVGRLRDSLCIDISNGNLEKNFPKILQRLQA